jgi:predicted PurR-regulated permease PerM
MCRVVPTRGKEHAMTDPMNEKDTAEENLNEAEQPSSDDQKDTSPRKKLFASFSKQSIFFGVLAIIAIVLYAIINYSGIVAVFRIIGSVISPVVVGCIIAYLCNPILKFYERRIFRRMKRGALRRGLSLLFAVVTVFLAIALILLMIVPQLVASIQDLLANYKSYIDHVLGYINGWINAITSKLSISVDISTTEKLTEALSRLFGTGGNLMSSILEKLTEGKPLVESVGDVIMNLVNVLKNLILSLFIAFYILSSKEKRSAQIKKFRKAFLSPKQDKQFCEVTGLVNRTFSGFIFGVAIDALVVGIVTFIILSIFNVSKYNLLIACIVAVTNIIPVFGPFIGGIPAAFIVLISNPSKFLLFILLLLIIQQVDGNILCPKIQGDNTGVSSLSVLIAITIAGSLWGIGGMVIGVPIFAVIIELFKRVVNNRLAAKGEPTDTTCYYPDDAVGNAEKEVHFEHAGLRYEYEHSRLKTRMRWMRRTTRRMLRQERRDELAAERQRQKDAKLEKKQQKKDKRNKK